MAYPVPRPVAAMIAVAGLVVLLLAGGGPGSVSAAAAAAAAAGESETAATPEGSGAPWQAADRIGAELFRAQSALLLDGGSGRAEGRQAARRAARSLSGDLRRGLAAGAPAELAALQAALDRAGHAIDRHDEVALAAARGDALAALRRGAFAVTLAATEAGDAARARAWLLIRDFRQSTRFTRPSIDATAALGRLTRGDAEPESPDGDAGSITPADAALAVRKDLLDAYQSRLGTNLEETRVAAGRGFGPRAAEAAALAAGYWRILAPSMREQLGPERTARAGAAFAALHKATRDRPPAAGQADAERAPASGAQIARLADRAERSLRGFTAAPFTPEEQVRRAAQFIRFLDLVPVEYTRGVSDGRVTLDFEIQEAVAFEEAAEQAFADLEPALFRRDRAATEAVRAGLAELRALIHAAHEQTEVAESDEVQAARDSIRDQVEELFPAAWLESNDQADYDLIDISLNQMVAAVNAGQKKEAESARLTAYAFFEFGPEIKLGAFDPGLALKVEGLVWYGADGHPGLASLISSGAPTSEVRETVLALGDALDEARAKTGEGASDGTVITNASLIVFREGLEAILIIAAITASMIGARAPLRRPIYRGALLALPASVLAYVGAVLLLGSLSQYGEKVEAVVGILAVGVLLVVLNWFFHRVYWTEWIAGHRRRGKELTSAVAGGAAAGAATVAGLYLLGFSSVFREGMETVLFLQALQLSSGTAVVLAGVTIGLVATGAVGVATFALERKLPYKKMLIVTGVLIAFVLFVMVGNTVRTLQGVGWFPIHTLDFEPPLWAGTWFGIYPTIETLGAQILAVGFVIGSYYLAGWVKKRQRRQALAAAS